MPGLNDIRELLSKQPYLTTRQIYQAAGQPLPLIQWVRQGHIMSAKTAKGLIYFMPENKGKIPRDAAILQGTSTETARPEHEPEKCSPVSLVMTKEDIKQLIELSKAGAKIIDVMPIKEDKTDYYQRNKQRLQEKNRAYARQHREERRQYQAERREELQAWKSSFYEDILSNLGGVLDDI